MLPVNIVATEGTAKFLKEHGIRTHTHRKIGPDNNDIINAMKQGHISYVINTSSVGALNQQKDGYQIRHHAIENNVTLFSSLDTVRAVLDVLEAITLTISTIDS